MKIALIFPPDRPLALEMAQTAAVWFKAHGTAVFTEVPLDGVPVLNDTASLDAYVAIGGDGTMLHCASLSVSKPAPMLGINIGKVGFLAETQPDKMEDAFACLISGSFQLERRRMLDICSGTGCWSALNDALITRAAFPRLLNLKVDVDNDSAMRIRADGVLISTPTGSTGYAISAGGPLVAPDASCLLITPICAHSFTARPLIVREDSVIRISFSGDPLMAAELHADGQPVRKLVMSDVITLRAGQYVELIHTQPFNFYETVRIKLIHHY